MHSASVEKSERLSCLLAFLRERGPAGATSWELMEHCRLVAAGTCVSELRDNGYSVSCAQERETETGRRVYRYRLLEEAAA